MLQKAAQKMTTCRSWSYTGTFEEYHPHPTKLMLKSSPVRQPVTDKGEPCLIGFGTGEVVGNGSADETTGTGGRDCCLRVPKTVPSTIATITSTTIMTTSQNSLMHSRQWRGLSDSWVAASRTASISPYLLLGFCDCTTSRPGWLAWNGTVTRLSELNFCCDACE